MKDKLRFARPFVLVTASCIFCVPVWAQKFNVAPASPVLLGDAVAISVDGLLPNQTIKIVSERVVLEWGGEKRALYRAEAAFNADASGKVDLATAEPKTGALKAGTLEAGTLETGTYKRADVSGLFWSMRPVKEEVPADRPLMEVRLRATNITDNTVIAEKTITFIKALADVVTEAVEQFPGAVFAIQKTAAGLSPQRVVNAPASNSAPTPTPTPTKRPAIILLGGSEGGSTVTRGAAQLASHGFAVLALPYYSPPNWPSQKAELPTLPAAFADIPIERLNEARAWLKTRADVDANRIAIHGTSKGAEFALLAAVHLPWVRAVVAIVPSDVVWEGWGDKVEPGKRASFAFNGKPFAFVPYVDFAQEFMGYQTGEDIRIRRPQDKGRAAHPAAAVLARIPVERIKAPVLLVAGQDDQVWNSAMMAHNIAERRAAAKLDTVSLIYTEAGHYLTGTGFDPTTQYDLGLMKGGGTPMGNAKAQADAWPKTIEFLKRTLATKN